MSAPEMLPFPVFDKLLANIYGVQLAGVFASCVLYGICCMQVFIYYVNSPKDHWLLKSLPALLIVMETVHQLLYCIGIYRVVILNFGQQSIVTVVIWEIFMSAVFQGIIATSSQAFFIYRIWIFSKKNWIFPLICIPISLAGFAGTVGDNILALSETLQAYTSSRLNTGLTYLAHGSDLCVDTIITVGMVILLHREKKSAFKSTNTIIRRLMVLTINTGLATATCTLLLIIFLSVQKNVLTYVFFNFLISPLYCNSVMANLNSRDYVRGNQKTAVNYTSGYSDPVELGSLRIASNPRSRTNGSGTATDTLNMESIDVGYPRKFSNSRTDNSTVEIGFDSRTGMKSVNSETSAGY